MLAALRVADKEPARLPLDPLDLDMVRIRTPSFCVASVNTVTASESRNGRGLGMTSSIVTLVPARAKTCANSSAMTPAPMNTRDAGRRFMSRMSSLVIASSPPGMASGRGFEPAAMRIFLPLKRWPATSMPCASTNRARP